MNIFSKGSDALTSKRPSDRTVAELDELSARTRELILRSVFNAGAGHIGGPLSVTDILVNLYFDRIHIDPLEPELADRDRVILSKGHSSIALYTVLALRGYFPIEELDTFDDIDSRLQGHPCMKSLPGIDMSTGSLGQGLSPGVGMALGARHAGLDFHTWVILGDGEIQEGQIWEACFVAARFGLGNLTVILDSNKLPQFGWPSEEGYSRTRPIDDPSAKFAAFGWATIECDGHDHDALRAAFDEAESATSQPVAIIANTIKGKGVSFMEANHNWHAKVPTQQELDDAVAELSTLELAGVGPA
jgi:transketolase